MPRYSILSVLTSKVELKIFLKVPLCFNLLNEITLVVVDHSERRTKKLLVAYPQPGGKYQMRLNEGTSQLRLGPVPELLLVLY